jgi:hypothetical protein
MFGRKSLNRSRKALLAIPNLSSIAGSVARMGDIQRAYEIADRVKSDYRAVVLANIVKGWIASDNKSLAGKLDNDLARKLERSRSPQK